jgi:hypothetical protein
MTTTLRSTASWRAGLLAASVLAAFGALLFAGLAVHGEPTALVNALGADELGKFAVVDMADALDRVAGPARASDAAK